jgi:Flp pilus assembly protein TadB
MLGLFGIRPNRLFLAIAGAAALVVGVVVHGPGLMVIGGLLLVWAAVTFAAGRRRRAQ